MAEKLTRSKIETSNRENVTKKLKELLEEEYGAVYEVADGLAIPVGKSPLDGAMMWVTVSAKAKTIQSHSWGKSTREYYDGYAESKAYETEKTIKKEKADERKRLSKEKAERDKKTREKKKEIDKTTKTKKDE